MPGNQAVVAGQAAVVAIDQRVAVHRDQIGICHISAVERGLRGGRHRFAADQPGCDAQACAGGGCAVIDLVRCSKACCQGLGRDVCNHRLAGRQAVVTGQPAIAASAERGAVDGHHIGRQHVLAVEAGAGRGADGFVANQPADDVQRRRRCRVAVIDLVAGGKAHRQRRLGDAGRQSTGQVDGVIARVVSAQAGRCQGHGLVGPGVLVGKVCAAGHQTDHIAAVHPAKHRTRHRRRGRAVIDFVAGHQSGDGQGFCRDVGCQTAGQVDRVVGRIGASQRQCRDRHRLGRANVLVGKVAAAAADRNRVTGKAVERSTCCKGGRCGLVVNLVAGTDTSGGQCKRRDAGAEAARVEHRVVAGTGAADGRAADRHGLVGANVPVGKAAAAQGQCHRIAADDARQRAAAERCRRAAVVDLVGRAGAGDGQRFGCDVGAQAARIGDRVVARVLSGDAAAADTDGLGRSDIRVGKSAAAEREVHRIAGYQTTEAAAAEGVRCAAVIDLAGRCDADERQGFGGDGTGARNRQGAQGVVRCAAAAQAQVADREANAGADILAAEAAIATDADAVGAHNAGDAIAAARQGRRAIVGLADASGRRHGQCLGRDAVSRVEINQLRDVVIGRAERGQRGAAGRDEVVADTAARKSGRRHGQARNHLRCRVAILQATDRVAESGVGCAVDTTRAVGLDQQGAGLVDRVVAADLGDGVVLAAGVRHQVAAVNAGIDGRAAARHQRAAERRRRFAVDEAAVANGKAGRLQVAINNGVAAGRHGQRRFGYAGAQIGRQRDAVVAGVGSAQGIAADADRLGARRILVGKTGACCAHGDAVAADQARDGGTRKRGHCGSVIHLVVGAQTAQTQGLGRDVGAQIGWHAQGVVALVGAAQRGSAQRDGLADAGVLVGEAGTAQRERHRITGQHARECAAAQRGARAPVIDLVVGRQAADRQRCCGYGECCRR